MTEYIRRKSLKERFRHVLVMGNDGIMKLIDEEPCADVVEVVRCKDCDVPHNKWLGCPNLNGLIPPPDFYCAKGKRKMNGKGDSDG